MLLVPFAVLPTIWAQKGPKWYWAGTVVSQVMFAAICIAWLLVPFAFWKSFGAWATLLWLLPTSGAVFALAFTPMGGG